MLTHRGQDIGLDVLECPDPIHDLADTAPALAEEREGLYKRLGEATERQDRVVVVMEKLEAERDALADEQAVALWSMLDDIDTLSDVLKEPMGPFQKQALAIAERRHAILESDGYTLVEAKP